MRIASAPLAAWPQISQSERACKIMRMPWITISWSSATKILAVILPVSRPVRPKTLAQTCTVLNYLPHCPMQEPRSCFCCQRCGRTGYPRRRQGEHKVEDWTIKQILYLGGLATYRSSSVDTEAHPLLCSFGK